MKQISVSKVVGRSNATRPDVEYRYIVHVRALETFVNRVRREGINIPDGAQRVSFASPKRLDLAQDKQNGLIWSYSVIERRYTEDLIEEG